jgi:hypothetical protein
VTTLQEWGFPNDGLDPRNRKKTNTFSDKARTSRRALRGGHGMYCMNRTVVFQKKCPIIEIINKRGVSGEQVHQKSHFLQKLLLLPHIRNSAYCIFTAVHPPLNHHMKESVLASCSKFSSERFLGLP